MADRLAESEPRAVNGGVPGRVRRLVPPPPIVASGLSGFAVGVFVTLLASGLIIRPATTAAPAATPPPATVVADSDLRDRVVKVASRVLGPMPTDPKRSRVLQVEILPIEPLDARPRYRPTAGYRSVYIKFRLYNHPFGPSWRLKTARGDVFDLLKALYTSRLPIYDVDLDGVFPLPVKHGKTKLLPAVQAQMSNAVAARIPWKRWGRADEAKLWAQLPYKWVSPNFA